MKFLLVTFLVAALAMQANARNTDAIIFPGETNAHERCGLPLETGLCRGYFPAYGFEDGACRKFIFGGCGGNLNNFATMADCNDGCVCSLKIDEGLCRGSFPQYGFENGECREFIHGGCGGNANKFDSIEECKNTCM